MTPKQREAAERLVADQSSSNLEWSRQVVALLRELLAAEPQTWTVEDCERVTKTLRYLQGIAERGEGRPMRDDETLEAFVLGYVKRLELLVEPAQEPGVEYKRGYEEALNDCIRNGGEEWARSMFANNAEHIKPVQTSVAWPARHVSLKQRKDKTLHIDNMRDEIEKLRADAERYRWLRANMTGVIHLIGRPTIGLSGMTGNDFDDAIDAALKEPT